MPIPQCIMTEAQVQEAFLAAPPLISQTILDLSIKHPSFLRDLWSQEEWPRGNGTVMEQLVFRGAMPQIERGFGAWKKLLNNSGCAPCDGPDCAYNWTDFGGNGFERKLTELMSREFRSPSYCIKQIQTTANFREVFAKIVENLYAQVDFFKEMNIGLNFLTGLAKKFVIDSDGPKPNRHNPYVYRNVLGTRLAAFNIEVLQLFYERMRRMPDAVPYDVVNGAPIYSLLASHEFLANLYRDDPNLRQDVRFSGLANDLLMKYNFMSTIRGMFIAAPILYPRRFNINAAGDPVEILPFVNNIPMEVGAFTGNNPAYEEATHEEVLIHGKFPFKVFYMPTEETLGANSSFGPEFSFFNNWMWINPMTDPDPFRRVGYFATAATMGLSQQYSDAIFGILFERRSVKLAAQYNPIPVCPPTDPVCDNTVPPVSCPCPLIVSSMFNPVTGNWILNLAVETDAIATDEVQFGIDTGGYITGTIDAVSEDSLSVEVDFGTVEVTDCDHFTTIFCDNTLGCSSGVLAYDTNCTTPANIDVVLQNNIKADVGDVVTVYYGDGTSAAATVLSYDLLTNKIVLDVPGTFCDQVGGILQVCIPTTTDATCPDCGGPTLTPCVT